MRFSIASTYPNLWRLLEALKKELEFSAMKNTQLLRDEFPNKQKSYQSVNSEIKCQLNILDDNEDAEELITNLANVINI